MERPSVLSCRLNPSRYQQSVYSVGEQQAGLGSKLSELQALPSICLNVGADGNTTKPHTHPSSTIESVGHSTVCACVCLATMFFQVKWEDWLSSRSVCWSPGLLVIRSAVLFRYPLQVCCKILPLISAVKPLDRKRRIQSVQLHIKGSTLVKHFTGWWAACVNCDCPEQWGCWTWRSVGDACQICSSVLSLCLWSTGRGEVLMCS